MAGKKQKTSRSAAKRFKVCKNRIKHRSANRNHILTKKAVGSKRQMRTPTPSVDKSDVMRVKRLLRLV